MAHAKLRYRALPLIASPLEQHRHSEHHEHKIAEHETEQTTVRKPEGVVTVYEEHQGTPAFREREEASSIELFYDLFFVANLTSFTNTNPIDDKDSTYELSHTVNLGYSDSV